MGSSSPRSISSAPACGRAAAATDRARRPRPRSLRAAARRAVHGRGTRPPEQVPPELERRCRGRRVPAARAAAGAGAGFAAAGRSRRRRHGRDVADLGAPRLQRGAQPVGRDEAVGHAGDPVDAGCRSSRSACSCPTVVHADALERALLSGFEARFAQRRRLCHRERDGVLLDHRARDRREVELERAGARLAGRCAPQPHVAVGVHLHEHLQVDRENCRRANMSGRTLAFAASESCVRSSCADTASRKSSTRKPALTVHPSSSSEVATTSRCARPTGRQNARDPARVRAPMRCNSGEPSRVGTVRPRAARRASRPVIGRGPSPRAPRGSPRARASVSESGHHAAASARRPRVLAGRGPCGQRRCRRERRGRRACTAAGAGTAAGAAAAAAGAGGGTLAFC